MRKQILIIILSMVIGMMFFSSTKAATFHWEGSISNNWNDPSNWRELSVPTSSDDVIFDAGSYDCLLNCPTTINSLHITADYVYQITIPAGCNLYISGNLEIDVIDAFYIWAEKPNITLNGNNNNQIIRIVDYNNWTLSNLTINKSGGEVTIESNIKTITFLNSSGTIINNYPTPYDIIVTCTPPQTGGIYHIANDFAY